MIEPSLSHHSFWFGFTIFSFANADKRIKFSGCAKGNLGIADSEVAIYRNQNIVDGELIMQNYLSTVKYTEQILIEIRGSGE